MPAGSEVQGPGGKGPTVATGAGFAAGLAAIVASSCCVLPILFVGLGIGGAAAVLIPTLAVLRPYLLATAVLAVSAAWVIHARRRRACATDTARKPTSPVRSMPVWLVLASAVVILALIWQPWIEPLLLPWVR